MGRGVIDGHPQARDKTARVKVATPADHPARFQAYNPDAGKHAGVPISIVSKWAGHYDSGFTQRTYLHASDDDLKQGRTTLAKIHKIA